MTRKRIIDIVRKIIDELKNGTKDLSQSSSYEEKLTKFPQISEVLIKLMSNDYKNFITDIEWVSPRPSTFRITLKNKNNFLLIWNDGEFIVEISGLRYDLRSLSSEQRAIKSLNTLTVTGPINPNKGVEIPPENNTSKPPKNTSEEPGL